MAKQRCGQPDGVGVRRIESEEGSVAGQGRGSLNVYRRGAGCTASFFSDPASGRTSGNRENIEKQVRAFSATPHGAIATLYS